MIHDKESGNYFSGYGNQCPHGCAVNGRCGYADECGTRVMIELLSLDPKVLQQDYTSNDAQGFGSFVFLSVCLSLYILI